MEYVILAYYLTYGMSTAFLMSKLAPASPLFWAVVIIAWPLFLPIGALMVYLVDKSVDDIDGDI